MRNRRATHEYHILDEIEAHFRRHPLWTPVAVQMWLTLPILFAYRARKTRQLLAAG